MGACIRRSKVFPNAEAQALEHARTLARDESAETFLRRLGSDPKTRPLEPAGACSSKGSRRTTLRSEHTIDRRRIAYRRRLDDRTPIGRVPPDVPATSPSLRGGRRPDQTFHHGAADLVGQGSDVRPRVVGGRIRDDAIGARGMHNVFGHPSPQTLAALTITGARVYRTDLDGGVSVVSDGTSIQARSMNSAF